MNIFSQKENYIFQKIQKIIYLNKAKLIIKHKIKRNSSKLILGIHSLIGFVDWWMCAKGLSVRITIRVLKQ